MKRCIIIFVLIVSSTLVYSQQFNSANLLTPRQFSVGVNPVFINNANLQSGIYLHGGMGLNRKTDLSVRIGVLEGQDYFGGDIEWLIRDRDLMSLSIITGAHIKHFFGLDGGIITSFPIGKSLIFFTGLDLDLNFEIDIVHYTWLPVGIEAYIKNDISLILEMDIPMSEWAWNIYGGGIVFYL